MNTQYVTALIEHLPNDLNKICTLYLEQNERTYYGNEWYKYRQDCIDICRLAAENGWLDLLNWARPGLGRDRVESGHSWNYLTCSIAAQNGHLHILKLAYKNNYPWDDFTCENAARIGRLDILEYLHENNCPWNVTTCNNAARIGRLDILEYLQKIIVHGILLMHLITPH